MNIRLQGRGDEGGREGGRGGRGEELPRYQEITIYIEICYVRSITKSYFFLSRISPFFFSTLKTQIPIRCRYQLRTRICTCTWGRGRGIYKGLVVPTLECCDPNNELIL